MKKKALKRQYTSRSEPEWRSIIDEYKTSTLTQQGFCEKRGIAISGFHHWRKRFSEASPRSTPPRFIEIPSIDDRLSVVQAEANQTEWDAELELSQSFIFRIRVA
ncbi:MAG: hypothetical protein ACI9Y1_002612 [Lentisphaeria bacterium]|jgi:hypothetical protein